MSKTKKIILAFATLLALGVLIYHIPRIQSALDWRFEKFILYIRNSVNPPGPVPTALPITLVIAEPTAFSKPTATSTPDEFSIPKATVTALPPQVSLGKPPYERQTQNNCGPATLSMALHIYGWQGNQTEIAGLIKPILQDRNVNPEELVWYVRNNAGWLNMDYRVGGDFERLKRLLASGYPVIIEATTSLDSNDALGPNDDLWAAHYLLLTGYDDTAQNFYIVDSYHEHNTSISYEKLAMDWKPFNYIYMFFYLPQEETEIESILGADWDVGANRERALSSAQVATETNPDDAFAWFNLGSNLVYFEQYEGASIAFDKSRRLGLPMRMFRYQFSPFIAYFQSNRIEDLLVLSDYALGITDKSEETWLWYGWALYRKGDTNGAISAWRKSLSIHPGYPDAIYALNFVGAQP